MADLIIYTQPTCNYSKELKEYLTKQSISFEERDITTDHDYWEELVDNYQARGTPFIVKGEKKVFGFNIEQIQKLVNP